ncbi:MAG: peptidylprolyl isomerase [Verrucomicrobia bacterium]|nr:peptidylprolyl isomerase [Verrucomicrobiota bacterium]
MKSFFPLFSAALLLVPCARAELVNGVYVTVNDAVITFQEVETAIAPLAELLAKQHRNNPQVFQEKLQQVRQEKIEELVDRQLVLHEFKTAGYQLPESVIDDVIQDRIKERFGNRATLAKTLQAQGISYETFRKQIREDYVVSAMIRTKISSEKILISPQKIENYYNANLAKYKVADQVKLRMIALNKKSEDDSAPGRIAQEILNKIKDGASFAEMASVYSDAQRAQGGDRGWIERDTLKKELSDVAFSLKPGTHSDVVDLKEACYILFAEEARNAHVKALPDVRDEIETTLKDEERTRLQKQWLDRLKAKSFVRYF